MLLAIGGLWGDGEWCCAPTTGALRLRHLAFSMFAALRLRNDN
jgi:hypothetical protein